MSQKSKTEGVRTSLVLSEHASTVRRLVRMCVCSRNFEEQNNEEAKASGAQFKKKRTEEEDKRAKEKGKSLNPVLA